MDCYPVLPHELIESSPQNFPLIAEKLGLPHNASEELIFNTIVVNLSGFGSQRVIARKIDIGHGLKNYLVFPEDSYIMTVTAEKRPLRAGRARKGNGLETNLYRSGVPDYLVISPQGEAYRYPAHLPLTPGVPVKNKPLRQVIKEVGERF